MDCRRHAEMALTSELGSQVIDANDNGMLSVQDSISCDVCGIVGSSPSELCAYLPRTQTVELRMAPVLPNN